MKRALLLLMCIALACGLCQATPADLMAPVPATAPAYAQLRLLETHHLLSASSMVAPRETSRLLTRYDVAFLLIEPLERYVALVEAQEHPTLTLEQQRRKDLAYAAISPLSPNDLQTLLTSTNSLLLTYKDVIEELSPGLPARAATALRKLGLSSFRPWLDEPASPAKSPRVSVSLERNAPLESFGDPLPLTNLLQPRTRTAMPFLPEDVAAERSAAETSLNAFRAAVNIGLGRVRVYGSLATLAGQDPSALIKPETANGKAMVGLHVNMFRLKDLGISGIFEYHILRTNEAGDTTTDTGAVGGIGLEW